MNRFVCFVLALCAVANGQQWPYAQPQVQYMPDQQWQYSQQQIFEPRQQFYQPQQQYYQPQSQYEPQMPQMQFGYYPGPYQYYPQSQQEMIMAVVKLEGATVNGVVNFTQLANGGPVRIQGVVRGLPDGINGFHVHAKGDITGGCLSAGAHFNPHNKQHGAPNDDERHVGDLGNIKSNGGVARFDFEDSVLSLSGVNNIVGRAVVVHQGIDDLGKTNHPDSKTTGNAGGRVACGVIGYISDDPHRNSSPGSFASHILLITAIFSLIKLF